LPLLSVTLSLHLLSVGTDNLRELEELSVLLMAFKDTLGAYLPGLFFDLFQFLAYFFVLLLFLFDMRELSLEGLIRLVSPRDFD
jgi:hypothetical protein